MAIKVSEYVETQTVFNDNDLFDVSAYLGVDSYESRKTLFSTLKEAIFPALSDVFTKDADDNVFYKGVTATLGTLCRMNIFYQASDATLGNGCQENVFYPRVGGITLGTGCIKNIFEGGTNTTFANNLLNVVIKSSTVGGSDYTNLTNYGFLYNNTYPAIIFGVGGTTNYHQYYDIANNRIVTTNLTTLAVSYIGGGSGGSTWTVVSTNQTAVNDGQYTVVANATFTDPITPAEGKGYWVLVRYGTATINSVGYSVAGTIIYRVFHSGSWATYVSLGVVNSGTQYRLAHYANNGTAVSENAAITAARALKSDANGLPIHFDTATEPSLTELSYVKGVTSAIQTQLNAKTDTFTLLTIIGTWASPADSLSYYAPIIAGVTTPTTTVTTFLSSFSFATKIIGIYVQHLNNVGTQGSNENVAFQIRNNTTSTSTQLINIQTNQASGVQKNFEDYSLNVSIAANDQIALQINTPAWATNPTNAIIRVSLFIQRT
jgi:hypothetical protein